MVSTRSRIPAYVYSFGGGRADGDRTMKDLLGGKGANLAEMSAIGLPVPPGCTISTTACAAYHDAGNTWPDGLREQVMEGLKRLEATTGRGLGNPERPLLLSVRSGAAMSMPGMMDTVLNLGLNDAMAEALAQHTGSERFAYDAYRRFIDMFGDVVMGVSHDLFEDAMAALKQVRGVTTDTELSARDLRELVDRYKAIYRRQTGYMFPDDPVEQLMFAIEAVFRSWNSKRARKYREINKIRGLLGTAVNVQAMVFGNLGSNSGTGVLFTRNPATGEAKPYGEFLVNAQGEDVVAGIRTPQPMDEMTTVFPEMYDELMTVTKRLEEHYANMQDIEFTIQDGELFVLQTRNGKRTGTAAVRIAVDMVHEGLVSKKTAVRDLVEPRHLEQLLHPRFKDAVGYKSRVIASGLPASPGAAVGKVVFTAEDAEEAFARDESVILVRVETSPEDVGGMHAAQGILTSRGGMTSHAAVVARGWGKPCVAGCGEIIVNYQMRSFTNGHVTVHEGDWISLNGSTGSVIVGKEELVAPGLSGDFGTFMGWADEFRTLKIRANADTPHDAEVALEFGAQGIGLCRTEHMFFEGDRILAMREMILAETEEERRTALEKILPYQKQDFYELFRTMDGLPVTIRLLDPPLHEFLPHTEEDQRRTAEALGVSLDVIHDKVEQLEEFNPMLGHRGCRLGITYPEITETQVRAILEAALALRKEGIVVVPEIMVPLVGALSEFVNQKAIIRKTAASIFEAHGEEVRYLVGTMIEVPRAVLIAEKIAKEAEFFSFGTNDLTQLTFGYSRDDVGTGFLPYYIEAKILPEDPFQSIDVEGVGELVQHGVQRGRAGRPDLKVGICGEHGGDPDSVAFFFQQGLDYVSCSPFRVPIARLASAQAAIDAQLVQEEALVV